MFNELRYFFTALMFFTRIPAPKWVGYEPIYLQKSRKYFPLVGWVVGAIAALIFGLAQLVLPIEISILLSMIGSVWITGAFHEDGFTDMCDGFGGGWTKEQVLTIMKDSRIGAYGTIAIILLLGLKFYSLYHLALTNTILCIIALVNGHCCSRFIASTFIHSHDYVRDIDQSKARPIANERLSTLELVYSFILAILPLGLFIGMTWYMLLLAFPLAYASKLYLGPYLNKRIGGYTGDCLGAVQQISEVLFYIVLLLLWSYL